MEVDDKVEEEVDYFPSKEQKIRNIEASSFSGSDPKREEEERERKKEEEGEDEEIEEEEEEMETNEKREAYIKSLEENFDKNQRVLKASSEEWAKKIGNAYDEMWANPNIMRTPEEEFTIPHAVSFFREAHVFLRGHDESSNEEPLSSGVEEEEYENEEQIEQAEDLDEEELVALDKSLKMYKNLQRKNMVPSDLLRGPRGPVDPIENLKQLNMRRSPYKWNCIQLGLMRFYFDKEFNGTKYQRLLVNRDPKNGERLRMTCNFSKSHMYFDPELSYQFLQLFFRFYGEMEKVMKEKDISVAPYILIEEVAERVAKEEKGNLNRIDFFTISACIEEYMTTRVYEKSVQERKMYYLLKNKENVSDSDIDKFLKDLPLANKCFVWDAMRVLEKGGAKYSYERGLDAAFKRIKFDRAPRVNYYVVKLKTAFEIGILGNCKPEQERRSRQQMRDGRESFCFAAAV